MLRLLVVDDDLGTREICTAALRHTAYAVNLADSGSAAITALSSGAKTHALLLDLKLGDLTGYDVLRCMRAKGVVVPTAVTTAFCFVFDPDAQHRPSWLVLPAASDPRIRHRQIRRRDTRSSSSVVTSP